MPGRPDFSASGTQGSGQTLAVMDRPEIVTIDATQTGTVLSGTSERTEIYAPTGSTYQIVGAKMKVNTAGSATTGTHELQLRPMDQFGSIVGRSDHTLAVDWANSHWQSANSLSYPPDTAAANMAMQAMTATENSPLVVRYGNDLDVDNPNDRIIKVVVKEASY